MSIATNRYIRFKRAQFIAFFMNTETERGDERRVLAFCVRVNLKTVALHADICHCAVRSSSSYRSHYTQIFDYFCCGGARKRDATVEKHINARVILIIK